MGDTEIPDAATIFDHTMAYTSAEIFVTKLGAARRLLRAAIRMYFHRDDELAVHTVASAAYGILKDLKKQRGFNEAQFAEETMVRGLLDLAKQRVSGKLSMDILSDTYFLSFLDQLVVHLKITPLTDVAKISPSVVISSSTEAGYWRVQNRASNFLKHADRDSEMALNLKEIKNFDLLMRAMISYESVAPDDLGFEGIVLQVYFLADLADQEEPVKASHPFAGLVANLRALSPDKRVKFSAFQLDRTRPPGVE